MKPIPWSYSALEDFNNCPLAFAEKRVFKTVRDEGGPHIDYGNHVHKAFELRQTDGRTLPDDLEQHEVLMLELATMQGVLMAERKIALDRAAKPCGFFDKDVWFRGVIDLLIVDGDYARMVDYKTGKPHRKFGQLKLFALWAFAAYHELQAVDVEFYWTKTATTTKERYTRPMVPLMWKEFVPDLRQFAEAFKTETFKPRPSGLCNGWCPVTTCQFWKPKRAA